MALTLNWMNSLLHHQKHLSLTMVNNVCVCVCVCMCMCVCVHVHACVQGFFQRAGEHLSPLALLCFPLEKILKLNRFNHF